MATTEQTKLVSDLLLFFEKAVRAIKIYPPANPICDEFLERLFDQLTVALDEVDPLRLWVLRQDLLHDGAVVYSNAEPRESISLLLHKDGLRGISLHGGLGPHELRDLVQGFNRDFTMEYLDDDLATYLWERELPHVEFELSEDYLDESLPEELRGAGEPQEEAVRRFLRVDRFDPGRLREQIVNAAALPAGRHASLPLRLPYLTPARLELTGPEAARLREFQSCDEHGVFYEQMLDVVFAILAPEESAEYLQTYLALFRSLLRSILAAGSIDQALILLRRLRAFASGTSPVAGRVGAFLAELGGSDLFTVLAGSLEGGAPPPPEEVVELLSLFPDTAIPGLTALLGTLTSMKWRKLICQVLARHGRRNLPLLATGLQDERWYVVRNLAYTFGLIGGAAAVPHLERLVGHPDLRVRREALRSLGQIELPAAEAILLQALGHDEAALRVAALRAMPKATRPKLAHEIGRLMDARDFARRPFAERVECARAFGRLSGDEAVPGLEKGLLRRWLRSGRRREEQHLLVLALVAQRSAAAREALQRSVDHLDGEALRLAQSFLLQHPPAKEGGAR